MTSLILLIGKSTKNERVYSMSKTQDILDKFSEKELSRTDENFGNIVDGWSKEIGE